MSALLQGVWDSIQWIWNGIADFFGTGFEDFFGGLVDSIVWLAQWLGSFLAGLLTSFIEILFEIAGAALSILPNMPEPDEVTGVSVLEQANAYLPVAESLALLGIWSTIFTGIGIYKLIKMISPVSS